MQSRELINTSTKIQHLNQEQERMQLQELVNEYFNSADTQKKLRQ